MSRIDAGSELTPELVQLRRCKARWSLFMVKLFKFKYLSLFYIIISHAAFAGMSSQNCGELSAEKIQQFKGEINQWESQSKAHLNGLGLSGSASIYSKFIPLIQEAFENPEQEGGAEHDYMKLYLPKLKIAVKTIEERDRKTVFKRTVKAINTLKIVGQIMSDISPELLHEAPLYICADDGTLGSVAIQKRTSTLENYRSLEYLLSSPDESYQGFGTAAVLEIIRSLKHGEGVLLKAATGVEGFYEKLGFEPCAHDIGLYCLSPQKVTQRYFSWAH